MKEAQSPFDRFAQRWLYVRDRIFYYGNFASHIVSAYGVHESQGGRADVDHSSLQGTSGRGNVPTRAYDDAQQPTIARTAVLQSHGSMAGCGFAAGLDADCLF